MPELLHKALTASILRAYYNAYNGTSRIYPERFYDRAMAHELSALGIPYNRQPEWDIYYKEKLVGKQALDILIAKEVVVEDKVAPALSRLHKAQLFSYLKTTGKQVGLLLNFGGPKPEFERLYFAPRETRVSRSKIEQTLENLSPAELIDPELVYNVVGGLFEIHAALGPGFIHRVYANACYHELRLRGVPVKPRKAIQVLYHGTLLGELKFSHLQAGDSLLVFPVAIQNPADLHPEMICDWLRHEQVPLGLIANFYEPALTPVFLKPRSI